MDASLQRHFLNNKLTITAGAKNLFNVTDVSQTSTSGVGIHGSSAKEYSVSYGTTLFTKATYKF